MVQPASDNGEDVVSLTSRRSRSLGCLAVVRRHSRARRSARAVLLVIASHADADGRNAWPAKATIAEEAGVAGSTVEAAIKALVALGELEVEQTGGGRRSSRYRILVEEILEHSANPPAREPSRPGATRPSGSTPPTVGWQGPDHRVGPTLDRPMTGGAAHAARCSRHQGQAEPPPCRGCAAARQAADVDEALRRAAVEARHAAAVKADLDRIARTTSTPAVREAALADIRATLRRRSTPADPAR